MDLNDYAQQSHEDNARWWFTEDGQKLVRNHGELFMLMVSEIAEAMEAERKDAMDDHLPHMSGVDVELADCLIRIFDYCAAHGIDIEDAYQQKRTYNATRFDHTYEARALPGGKKF